MAMAVWQSTNNDYTQRAMLRSLITAPDTTLNADQGNAIKSVLDEVDNSLRHKRNSALHAPLMYTRAVVDDAVRTFVEPSVWTPNPHAHALRSSIKKRAAAEPFGKGELIEELNWYAQIADALARQTGRIHAHLCHPEPNPLPDKLKLPQPPPVRSPKA